ncbi:xanthine dehydrogenase accessory protein XdhC [Aureimonas sp. ME7]|uniref:xanthine dehydrogenase accessory protein XdhC n=1 Tax=Aureimonas sp. ME7 TaxID=2744252 RepID=UPI001FCEA882|nr:xanthine dehydrogenase accessory protein XdhC [Aureimonas sp. ME7]
MLADLRAALERRERAMVVRVERALGSTPREAGAAMLVTPSGVFGTVGGGALEMEGIVEARRMLEAGEREGSLDIPLGPAIGQCCGGRVVLSLRRGTFALLEALERQDEAERFRWPHVYLFGAGHTGQATARALAALPLRTMVFDARADRLAELPSGVERRRLALPEDAIADAPPGTAFVVMTHDHALDFLIAAAALERQDAAYVGMIGSATKRQKFARFLADRGEATAIDRLVLPIGAFPVRDKRPAVIAVLVVAELVVQLLGHKLDQDCAGFATA